MNQEAAYRKILRCTKKDHSASNRYEYQECFLGRKDDRCIWLTSLPPHKPIIIKSGNLNLLETSEHLQACTGISLPLPLLLKIR